MLDGVQKSTRPPRAISSSFAIEIEFAVLRKAVAVHEVVATDLGAPPERFLIRQHGECRRIYLNLFFHICCWRTLLD